MADLITFYEPAGARQKEIERLAGELGARLAPSMTKLDALAPEKRIPALQATAAQLVDKTITENNLRLHADERTFMIQEIMDDLLGYGPIEAFLRDDLVDEVMVNGPKQIYVERRGKLILTNRTFRNNDHVVQCISRIVTPLGKVCDERRPLVDARLPDGSRVNAIVPPLAIDGASITIRKFKKDRLTIDDLVRFGTLSQEMADFLGACVKGRLNIVVSGGTGSGKTTTLNILSNFIPDDERIVTIEDAAELQIRKQHVVRLETRAADLNGEGAVTIRDLVRNSLRMRPERIVVGEIRGAEAFDMLQAMNTGHDGSLTTGHANTPRDMVRRIESMCMMAGMDIPMAAIREQIASAVHLFIQQSRLQDGSRRITYITELQGMEGATISLSDIFLFKHQGFDSNGKIMGSLQGTGMRPKFEATLKHHGITLSNKMFGGR